MKTKKDIDNLIKQSLNEEDAKFYDNLEEPSILETFYSIFKGKNSWVMIFSIIITLILIAFTAYALVNFFNSGSTDEMLKWGLAIFASLSTISLLKLYSWMQMNKNVMLREIKRLELKVSLLSGKIEKNKPVRH